MKWLFLLLAACSSDPVPDVIGPFTGSTTRFAIDKYTLPMNAKSALSDDLDGDGKLDNQLGNVFGTLAFYNDLTTHDDAMRALLTTTFSITATDLTNDPHAAVSFGDGVEVGGRFVNGVFASNRTATSEHLATGTIALPIFADADPSAIPLQHAEIDLVPDATGYVATVRGLIASSDAVTLASAGIIQMVTDNPRDHGAFGILMDANHDGIITADEVASNQLVISLLAPDIAPSWTSFGFSVHLVNCAAGSCSSPSTDTCFDRVQDGDETAVDCGGSCQPCGSEMACKVAADCQTAACNGGLCAKPACDDGIQDGFETGVDCGPYACKACLGDSCERDSDCAAGRCSSDAVCVP